MLIATRFTSSFNKASNSFLILLSIFLAINFKLLDSFNDSYNDLINEKENNGISTESWLKREIISSASNAGLSDEDQTKVLEVVGEAIAINNNETLKTLNSHE